METSSHVLLTDAAEQNQPVPLDLILSLVLVSLLRDRHTGTKPLVLKPQSNGFDIKDQKHWNYKHLDPKVLEIHSCF